MPQHSPRAAERANLRRLVLLVRLLLLGWSSPFASPSASAAGSSASSSFLCTRDAHKALRDDARTVPRAAPRPATRFSPALRLSATVRPLPPHRRRGRHCRHRRFLHTTTTSGSRTANCRPGEPRGRQRQPSSLHAQPPPTPWPSSCPPNRLTLVPLLRPSLRAAAQAGKSWHWRSARATGSTPLGPLTLGLVFDRRTLVAERPELGAVRALLDAAPANLSCRQGGSRSVSGCGSRLRTAGIARRRPSWT